MKILVHICCAPCAVHVFPKLKQEFDEVMGLWYNPNIHPFREYQLRLNSVKKWAEQYQVKVIYEDVYDIKSFLREIVYRESHRCFFCYRMRLKKTAIFAKKGKFDYFGSTLISSPHQDSRLIQDVANEIAKEYSVKPYLKVMKEGWKQSQELSKKLGLYHQQYCGCIYSEEERFKGKNGAKRY